MRRVLAAAVLFTSVLWITSVVAQTPGAAPGPLVLNPIAATSGTGVSNVALLDRPEVRVLRVDVQPGGVRNIHTHDDTQFHLFIPVSGGAQFESEPNAPVNLDTWQAQFIKGGTRHGFKNTGTKTATVIEVFVKLK
jgi:quercetin dioxygenase-like cupin family protein